jgi:hypothetical protein
MFIPLTNSPYKTIVSDHRYNEVMALDTDWYCQYDEYGKPISIMSVKAFQLTPFGPKKQIALARFILRILDKSSRICSDHIYGNIFDNRDDFLRTCTQQQNKCNRKKHSNNKSGHKNIHWHAQHKKWQVGLKHKKKAFHIGYFENLEDAIKERDKAVIKYHGKFARLC